MTFVRALLESLSPAGLARGHRPLGGLIVALAAFAWGPPAIAADAVRGNTLYHATPAGGGAACSLCHGADPAQNQSKIQRGANNATLIQSAITANTGGMGSLAGKWTLTDLQDIAAYIANPAATGAPVAAVSPASLAFASTTVGTTSAASTVTLSNTGNAALSLASIGIGGLQAAEFGLVGGGSCAAGGTVAAGASCTVLVSFAPQASGARSATLTLTHNAAGGSSAVALSGTGAVAPQPSLSVAPNSVNFGNVTVGTNSASQTITLTNTGNAALNFGSIALSGPNAAQFGRAGTCSVGVPVAAGASCTLVATFSPVALGTVSATVAVTSNAPSNPTVPLSGTGTAVPTPVAALSPAAIAFGNQTVGVGSAVQSFTLANAGSAALAIGSVTLSGAGAAQYAIASNDCPASLAGAAQCSIGVRFTPAAIAASAAQLDVVSNASNGAQHAAVTGTGVSQPTASPVLGDSLPIGFATTEVGRQSTAHVTTLSNQGTAAFTLATLAITGTHAGDFVLVGGQPGDCVLGQSVAPGGSCAIRTVFAPAAGGARSARVALSTDGGAQLGVGLTGTGTVVVTASAALAPQSLAFVDAPLGQLGAVQRTHLSNTGALPVSVGALSVQGPFAVVSGAGACAAVPFDLQPGAGCDVWLAPSATVEGALSGTLLVTTSASAVPMQVALAGTATKSVAAAPVSPPATGAAAAAPTAAGDAAAPAAGAPANAGLGGCTAAAEADDPLLLGLAMASLAILTRRRRAGAPTVS
jgi:cytochrome c553